MFCNQKYQNYQPTTDESSIKLGEHNLFDEFDPSLKYQSIFKYFQMPSNNDFTEENQKINHTERLISSFIVLFMFIVVIITFPITGFFVIKKIKPLERCLVYRLGKRMPIKGKTDLLNHFHQL